MPRASNGGSKNGNGKPPIAIQPMRLEDVAVNQPRDFTNPFHAMMNPNNTFDNTAFTKTTNYKLDGAPYVGARHPVYDGHSPHAKWYTGVTHTAGSRLLERVGRAIYVVERRVAVPVPLEPPPKTAFGLTPQVVGENLNDPNFSTVRVPLIRAAQIMNLDRRGADVFHSMLGPQELRRGARLPSRPSASQFQAENVDIGAGPGGPGPGVPPERPARTEPGRGPNADFQDGSGPRKPPEFESEPESRASGAPPAGAGQGADERARQRQEDIKNRRRDLNRGMPPMPEPMDDDDTDTEGWETTSATTAEPEPEIFVFRAGGGGDGGGAGRAGPSASESYEERKAREAAEDAAAAAAEAAGPNTKKNPKGNARDFAKKVQEETRKRWQTNGRRKFMERASAARARLSPEDMENMADAIFAEEAAEAAAQMEAEPTGPQLTREQQETLNFIERDRSRIMAARYWQDVLGLGFQPTRAQVKQAYHFLARIYHPDKSRTLGVDTTAEMQRINDAFHSSY